MKIDYIVYPNHVKGTEWIEITKLYHLYVDLGEINHIKASMLAYLTYFNFEGCKDGISSYQQANRRTYQDR